MKLCRERSTAACRLVKLLPQLLNDCVLALQSPELAQALQLYTTQIISENDRERMYCGRPEAPLMQLPLPAHAEL